MVLNHISSSRLISLDVTRGFTNEVKSDVNLHLVVLLPKVFLTDRGRLRRRTQQRTSSVNHRRSRLYRKLQQCVVCCADYQQVKGGGVSLEALLRGRGGAIGGGQRHQTVSAPQVSLQSFLIGRLQTLEELLRLPTEVTVETPVTPATAK